MKWLPVFFTAGLLPFSVSVMADAPVLSPPAQQNCQITGSRNRLDFGTHTRAQLTMNSRGKLTPGQQSVQIAVVCRFPKKMVLSVADSAAGSQFAWGSSGRLRLEIQDMQLDNRLTTLRRPAGRVAPSESDQPSTLYPGERFSPSRNGEALFGRQLSFILLVSPEWDIAHTPLNQRQDWQSSLTLRLE